MKGRVVALDVIAGKPAAALIVDGRVEDLLATPRRPGVALPETVFRAVVDRPLKGQGGTILRLPDGQSGFLRHSKGLRPGQGLLVQVTGHAEAGKAVPVAARLLFKGRFAIVTPGAPGINVSRKIRDDEVRARLQALAAALVGAADGGLILRSDAAAAAPEAVEEDIRALLAIARKVQAVPADGTPERLLDGPDPHALARRDWLLDGALSDDPGCFDGLGVHDAIHGFLSPQAALPDSGALWIEPTHALVAVDVNTGADTSPAAGLKTNLAMARELPRQLRCRGLGGQIVIDPAPMPKTHRRRVEQDLRRALAADPIETALAGWTTLGLMELQRKRERLPLSETVAQ